MATIITIDDLPAAVQSAELVDAMIDGANAKASRVAPCLASSPTSDQTAEARLILVGAIKRWAEAGSGAVQQQSVGAFSMAVDTRQKSSGFNLWPSEIRGLQDICKAGGNASVAYSIDTTPTAYR